MTIRSETKHYENEADRDIGMCDMCGSEEDTRIRRFVDTTINGEPARVGVWLCRDCRKPKAS